MSAKKAGQGAIAGAGAGAAFGPWGVLAGGALGGVAGLLGGDDYDPSKAYEGIDIPDVAELENAGRIDGSAFDSLSEDPATRMAQLSALSQMKEAASSGGMDLQSRVAQDQMINRSNQNDAANRAAALNQMAMRGQASGGGALAAQLSGAQSSAQANAMGGAQMASDARSRALQAMSAYGQQAGQIRGQDWSNASDKAAARDRINQFNSQNAQNAYRSNMGWQLQKAGGQAGAEEFNRENDLTLPTAASVGKLGGQMLDPLRKKQVVQ
jgi:hypothetical protein